MTGAAIRAQATRRCQIPATGRATVTSDGKRVRLVQRDADTFEFAATAGRRYQIAFDTAK